MTEMISKRRKGYEGENLVKEYYVGHWYKIIEGNFTIKGGEIDIIAMKDDLLVFIEVKTISPDLSYESYITPSKIKHFKNAIEAYLAQHTEISYENMRADVVFVENNMIYELFEDIPF